MRVSLLSSGFEKCGIASYSRDLEKGLKDRVSVTYESFSHSGGLRHWLAIADRFNQTSDVVHVQHHPHFCGYWQAPLQTHQFHAFIKRLTKPLVITIHDLMGLEPFRPKNNEVKKIIFDHLVKPAMNSTSWGIFLLGGVFKGADKLIVHWEHPKRELVRLGIDPEKISVLYPGIPAISAKTPEENLPYRGKIKIGIFGFIRPHKGLETAFKALKTLPENIVFVCVGEVVKGAEDYYAGLKALVRGLGIEDRIFFTGYLSDQESVSLLKTCDLILLPYEPATPTASYAINFAFAAERPILTSDTPYFREIFERYGCIKIFQGKNSVDLAEKILALLKDSGELPKHAKVFCEDWSWAKVAEKTIAVYEAAIKARSRGSLQ